MSFHLLHPLMIDELAANSAAQSSKSALIPWLCRGGSTLNFMRIPGTPPTITSSLPAISDVGGRRP